MTVEEMIFSTLGPVVSGRCYPDQFKQDQAWPAIRYTFISGLPDVTICGNGTDLEADFHIQVDGVAKTDADRNALRVAIQAAMVTFPWPATCESWTKDSDPLETKAFRVTLDYLLEPSSD